MKKNNDFLICKVYCIVNKIFVVKIEVFVKLCYWIKKWKIFNLFIVFFIGFMGRFFNMGMLWFFVRDIIFFLGKILDVF